MYEQILVPVDGSEASMDAVSHAAGLASVHGADLHVVHVLEPQVAVESAGVDVTSALEEVGERAIADAESVAREAGIEELHGSLLTGAPHRRIVEYAEDNDVGLIVMGTHGRTGLARLLLGSVAEKVVRTSPVPVSTIRPRDAAE